MTNDKTLYQAPAMTVLGSFETLTQGGGGTAMLDADFPTHTPAEDLTFS